MVGRSGNRRPWVGSRKGLRRVSGDRALGSGANLYGLSRGRWGWPESPRLLGSKETLQYALDGGLALARLGDGELALSPFGEGKGILFQEHDEELSRRLGDLLRKARPGVLVCFCNLFSGLAKHRVVLDYERNPNKKYSGYLSVHRQNDIGILPRRDFRRWNRQRLWEIAKATSVPVLGEATCFHLCYFFEAYRAGDLSEVFALYRRLFEGKRALFVCPEQPLGKPSFRELVGRGVIGSCESVRFLDIPEKNCFREYDRILEAVLGHRDVDAVYVQAGPTATVLAAELASRHGLMAHDVGSLNISLQRAHERHGIVF